ncbi:MAG TPA: NAD-dependent epimerase/dehydratase family protein [Gemmataceae bacterium]|nr:NAD-dependent epimerase/dehydratase family protein [Gemmataceae bacterium]
MNALVTGGGGFLGGAIVRRLAARGDEAASFSRSWHPALEALGVEQSLGDVADAVAVDAAVAGRDIVFHVAAKAGVWGPYVEYHRANVVGTQNVLSACRKHSVRRLVFTSSPSVVFNGRDMEGVDESIPYPDHYEAAYAKTKAEAERLVLAANDSKLATVALRPHLIWGPGDNQLTPRILERGRAGKLRRIGRTNKRIDATYIDNAADAHIHAADRLAPGSPVAGKAYFIANGEPIPLWDLVNGILAACGVPPVTRTIPVWLAYTAGWLMETAYTMLRRRDEPPMTRFVARELTTAHWFNLTAARRDLGYEPEVSSEEGLKRLSKALAPTRGIA